MALTPLATPTDGVTSLTAAIWNNEFRNIYNNGLALISPLTGTLNAGNNQITNLRLENLTATPTSAQAGRVAFVTLSGNKLFILDDGTTLRYVPHFSTAVAASSLGAVSQVVTATGACTWPAMNSGATISTSITVTGATGTDQVLVSHSAVLVASVLMTGYVTAANTVTVALYNGTGATYNPGHGTLRATLFKYA